MATQSHREDCSATLVAQRVPQRANTIITAWHCLEFYRDLSKPISFTLPSDRGRPFQGGLSPGGWRGHARRLGHSTPVPARSRSQVAGIACASGRADPQQPITMAGYSRDAGIGRRGEQLTYDADCRITAQTGDSTDSNCLAHKGASGGAVVQLSLQGHSPVCRGCFGRGDGAGLSIYVPVSRFRSVAHSAYELAVGRFLRCRALPFGRCCTHVHFARAGQPARSAFVARESAPSGHRVRRS